MGTNPKPARRSRAELKQLMIDGGMSVLLDLPPVIGAEQLTYSLVFEHLLQTQGVKVTTGSIHERIWQSQREFQLEVMAEIVTNAPDLPFGVAESGALEALAEADLTTVEGRRYAARNTTRLMQNRSFNVDGFRSREEALAYALRFYLWERDDQDAEHDPEGLAGIALAHRQASVQLYAEMIQGLMAVLGLRTKPIFGDDTVQILATLGNAMFLGPATDPMPVAQKWHELPTGLNGEIQKWHSGSIGLWALVQGLLELDGDDLTDAERQL